MEQRPRGVVTFLFTNIVQSSRRWGRDPDAMREAPGGTRWDCAPGDPGVAIQGGILDVDVSARL